MGNNQNTYFEEKQKKQKMDERTNNDLQNTTQKTNDRVTRTLLKPGVNSCK